MLSSSCGEIRKSTYGSRLPEIPNVMRKCVVNIDEMRVRKVDSKAVHVQVLVLLSLIWN
jgi:hypothetical protein